MRSKTAFVEQGHNGMVLNGLSYRVDGFDDAAEGAGGVLVFFHQRRSREGDFAGVGQHAVHLYGQFLVLATVGFVDENEDVRVGKGLLDLFDGRGEFVDDGGDDRIGVAFQEFHKPAARYR